jgi:hypothetical protein
MYYSSDEKFMQTRRKGLKKAFFPYVSLTATDHKITGYSSGWYR